MDALIPEWANPLSRRESGYGFRDVGGAAFGFRAFYAPQSPHHGQITRTMWDGSRFLYAPPLPFYTRPANVNRLRAFFVGLDSPLYKARSIFGAWAMRLMPGDPATRRLARANRKPTLRQLLPPSHDLRIAPRWAMPAILPIKGIG